MRKLKADDNKNVGFEIVYSVLRTTSSVPVLFL